MYQFLVARGAEEELMQRLVIYLAGFSSHFRAKYHTDITAVCRDFMNL